jgi:hypothetical protein
MEKAIMFAMAGEIAQRLHRPASVRSWHGRGDYKAVSQLSSYLCGSGEEESAYLKWLYIRARQVVDLRARAVKVLGEALITRKTLTGDEVLKIILDAERAV